MTRLAAPLVFALTIIISVLLLSSVLRYRFRDQETITVTGLAEKDFTADQIVWQGNFTRSGMELRSAYAALKTDESEIRRYLNAAGIPDSNILFSSVNMNRNYQEQFDERGRNIGSVFNGYSLNGMVTVDSRNIAVVERLSREITGLLEKGIELNSIAPRYYFSGLNALKIDLLARASEDARQRAGSIAKNSGVNLGDLKKASMGVFQITGKNSNEDYSYGGAYNTSSKEKTASITVRVDYHVN